MNFHAKSGVCSSKNERVMALGTKEDGHTLLSILYIQAIIQSKLQFVKLFEVWTKSVLVEGKGVSEIWKMAAKYMNVFQVEHKNIITQN